MVASGRTRFYSSGLMRRIVRILIRIYQATLSPILAFLGGPASGCRFQPTCSEYFLEAVEVHGALRGSWLGLKRLGRCHPWGGRGEDPVPVPTPDATVACHAVASSPLRGEFVRSGNRSGVLRRRADHCA